MKQRINEWGQPVGAELSDWRGAARPGREPMLGRFCRIETLDVAQHLSDLFEAYAADESGALWTYMPKGPFTTLDAFEEWMELACRGDDPLFYALIERATGKAVGIAAYLRITPEHGVIEVGNLTYSPRMQRTPMATEAMYLMMQRVFNELGYRRYEWKCDSLNEPSRRAAERLGFSYDGLFRQALVYKGRNRDTAWYSILDRDWSAIEQAFKNWFDPANFDSEGQQKQTLATFIGAQIGAQGKA